MTNTAKKSWAAALLVVGSALILWHLSGGGQVERGVPASSRASRPVTLDEVPPPVRAALERESAGGRIEKIKQKSREGRTYYEAEVDRSGKDVELELTEDGTLVAR